MCDDCSQYNFCYAQIVRHYYWNSSDEGTLRVILRLNVLTSRAFISTHTAVNVLNGKNTYAKWNKIQYCIFIHGISVFTRLVIHCCNILTLFIHFNPVLIVLPTNSSYHIIVLGLPVQYLWRKKSAWSEERGGEEDAEVIASRGQFFSLWGQS